MKKVIFVIIFLSVFDSAFSQDTNIVKFMPLKIGNVWVYNYYVTQRIKLRITGTTIANNHLYYIFEQLGTNCTCMGGSYFPFLIALQPMRVDSITGNLYFLGGSCTWHPNENLVDSLKIRLGDNPNNACNRSTCTDTAQQNIFGTLRRAKYIGTPISPYISGRNYAYGIGMYKSNVQCSFSSACIFNLSGCVIDGVVYGDTSYLTGISQISSEVPNSFSLSQNYPNPFNPTTKIKFDIPADGKRQTADTKLTIYDALGKEVATIVNEQLQPGNYETEWDASNYPSGVYFYQLIVNSEQLTKYTETKKLVLIK